MHHCINVHDARKGGGGGADTPRGLEAHGSSSSALCPAQYSLARLSHLFAPQCTALNAVTYQ